MLAAWSVMSWIARYFRYLRHKDVDGGTIGQFFSTPSEQSIGLRVDGSSLVAVVEIAPPRDYLTRIGRHSFDASHLLPTAALVDCLHQHDISLTGIDIVSHGYRAASGTPATEVYERLSSNHCRPPQQEAFGLHYVSTLSRVLRAVERRGGGEQGRGPRDRCCRQSCHPGSRYSRMQGADPDRTGNCLVHGPGDQRSGRQRGHRKRGEVPPCPACPNVGYGIEPRFITASTLTRIWAVANGRDIVRDNSVAAPMANAERRRSARHVASPRAIPPENAPLAGLVSLRGRQRDGLLTNLPTALAALDGITPDVRMDGGALDSLALPLAGCGQLIGSDRNGHGVAARISGPGVNIVLVAGELYLAQQLIFRAIATGALVLVHTDRPQAWTAPHRLDGSA